MKKYIFYLIGLIVFGFIPASCSLEEDPNFVFYSKAVFDSEETTEAAIRECYGALAKLYGGDILKPTLANGTMVARVKASEETRAAAYDVDPEGGSLTACYQDIYKMIDNSNRIISDIGNSSLSPEYVERSIGHAYFIRGYAYYLLGSLWGRAAIQLEPVYKKESLMRPLSSRVEVYEQAESDWLLAAEKLPLKGEMHGMANKNAAYAYLAKLYFMLGSQKQSGLETSKQSAAELWKKTIQYGEKVEGKEFLEPDYAKLFGPGVCMSKEILFDLNYTSFTEKGVQKKWHNFFGPYFYSEYTSVINNTDAYRTAVMDRAFYDFHAGSHPGDARIKTIYLNDYLKETRYKTEKDRRVVSYPYVLDKAQNLINGRDFMLQGSDPKNPQYDLTGNHPDPRMKYVKDLWTNLGYGHMSDRLFPYSGKGADKKSYGKYYDSNNVILFRNADLLLILADAYNETGNAAKADEYLNMVLTRAKLPKVSGMGQSDRREYIFFERMFELAGEAVVFEDIRRRGTEFLKKVIKIHNDSWFENFRYNLEREKNNKTEFIAIMINDKKLDEDFLKKNLLLPIPQREIIQNDNINQEDQNFGYY